MRPLALIVLVAVALAAPGCSTWRAARGADPAATPKLSDPVRIELQDGAHFVLENPTVVGDTLQGTDASGQSRRVALSDIKSIEIRKFNLTSTLGLLLLIGAVGYGLFLIVAYGAAGT